MFSPAYLSTEEIHVWRIALDGNGSEGQVVPGTLSPDELRRAERFAFTADRRRWTAARSAMRTILGRYMDLNPASVRFYYGPHGKPHLDQRIHNVPLHFNLTHSGDLALLALGNTAPLGIDVEFERDISDALEIARQFFCREELAELRVLSTSQLPSAFFRCWTRKEAYLKANGSGLSVPLNRVRVSFDENKQARIIAIDGSTETTAAWRLVHLAPGLGFVGAIAIESRRPVKVKLIDFTPGTLVETLVFGSLERKLYELV